VSAVTTPRRDGFSLIEVVVAMMIFSVSLMALAPVLLEAVTRQRTEALRLERTIVLLGATNRLLAVPYGDLDAEAGCKTYTGPRPFAHEQCVSVAGTGREREITIVVTPVDVYVGADSMVFSRARQGAITNPFDS
jgi:prepilin-type N-terminal cleavage/methylation domain-containing protein